MRAGRSGGRNPGRDATADLARGLGMFSLALGSAELAAPGAVARLAGVRRDGPVVRTVTSLYGARELAHGAGILSGRATAGWVWSRVAGDALDMATLSSAETHRLPSIPAIHASRRASRATRSPRVFKWPRRDCSI